MKGKKKYYTVWKGRKTGVFDDWEKCRQAVHGFEGAVYKSFETLELAEKALKDNPWKHLTKKTGKEPAKAGHKGYIRDSLAVDAACSGNPGVLEYRGVDPKHGTEIFRQGPFPEGTINLGEFLAIVHGLAYLKQRGMTCPVYSDSRTALKWVKSKAIRTKLERTPLNEGLFQLVDRALAWLKENSYENPVLKWETGAWGENPADFGRK